MPATEEPAKTSERTRNDALVSLDGTPFPRQRVGFFDIDVYETDNHEISRADRSLKSG